MRNKKHSNTLLVITRYTKHSQSLTLKSRSRNHSVREFVQRIIYSTHSRAKFVRHESCEKQESSVDSDTAFFISTVVQTERNAKLSQLSQLSQLFSRGTLVYK